MTTIAELDDKLKVTKLGPALPQEVKAVNDTSFDERFAELNRIPLFMQDLDETDGSSGTNTSLEALKSLAFDGEPWEIATSFKENGNESFKRKSYKDAIEFYTKAIQTKCDRPEIDEACYVNRAACNLELQNYGKVLGDCSKALNLNPKNMKALYRSAKACIAVDRLDEAQDVITRGLLLEPDNKALKAQLDVLEKKLQRALDKRKKEDARIQRQQLESRNLATALRQRNITITHSKRPPDTADAKVKLTDPLDPSSSLLFPTMFLYPLTYQSDFLAQFSDASTIGSQLALILSPHSPPPSWDLQRTYSPTSVDCFMETRKGGLLKIGKRAELGIALGSGKVHVVDGILRIYVLPKNEASGWIERFKKEKELTRGQ